MSDRYLDLTSGGPGRKIAKTLGLPQPAVLRRTDPDSVDSPLAPGTVLLLTDGTDAAAADAAGIVDHLLGWGVDVRRDTVGVATVGAVVVVATGIGRSGDFTAPALALGAQLRSLGRSGRVVVVYRDAEESDSPALAASRAGIDGFVRTVAKEMRGGATANGIALTGGVDAGAPSPAGALRFLLAARSAFVSGQILHAGPGGSAPADWRRPLSGHVVAVTGAARGIGAQIVAVAARDGAKVVGIDVPAAGEALAATMNAAGGISLQLDVTADDAADRILAAARARYGRLDVVVHNAGILRDKLLANMTEEKFASLVAVNIAAPVRMNETFAAPGALGDADHAARIISLASTSGIAGNRGQSNY
ncbi:MAG: SDR family NAD(P)-dependent oxidoreductase, partial [Actinomycetales bacterium]